MTGSRWWKDFDTAVAAALPRGSRVLDAGCGDGGLVDRLGELGFDALGVDPAAPAHPGCCVRMVDRCATWLARHDSSDADNSVPGWRCEHGGLHSGATIKEALCARFEPLLTARRPYLARMLARRDLEAREQALIDVQVLPALGFWMIAGHATAT